MWKMIILIPFFVLICAAVHELGHAVGCGIRGRKIYEIRIPFLCWRQGKIVLTSKFESCCIFDGKENNVLIFLLGPLFSFLHASLWGIVFLCFKKEVLFMCFCLATLAFLTNMIPVKNSDIQKIVEGLK